MKNQGNKSPTKLSNSVRMDSNEGEVDEILGKQFQTIIIRMINESTRIHIKSLMISKIIQINS
jgi:hypothetical protein